MRRTAGQAIAEFAVVFPIFTMILMSVIVLGLYVFYNQQLQNAAREAARYASVHSTSAQCPTVSHIDPNLDQRPLSGSYTRNCDAPEDGWPKTTAAARASIWGMAPNLVSVRPCWSGYVESPNKPNALPQPPNVFTDCTIGAVNPQTSPGDLPCPVPAPTAALFTTTDGEDKASPIAFHNVPYVTTVTVYTCFQWKPPLAGFLFLPDQITIRAVVTEAMQRQQ